MGALLAESAIPPRARRRWLGAITTQQLFSHTHTQKGTKLLGQTIAAAPHGLSAARESLLLRFEGLQTMRLAFARVITSQI